MKKMIVCGMMVLGAVLVATQNAWPQGTITYLNSLNQSSAGSEAVASDSWLAEWFQTGNNPGGYVLNSVQLAMLSASGAPSGFTVDLYSVTGDSAAYPGSILATLNGPGDPETVGNYSYTASGLTLSPSTDYYLVLTAGTPISTGAYAWSLGNSLATSSGGWRGSPLTTSSDQGSQWTFSLGFPEYALTATAVPEPCPLILLTLSGMVFFAWRCRQAKPQSAQGKCI